MQGAAADRPYIFVDFTGVTCTNCKLNEQHVFSQPAIKSLLGKYTLVSLYTDDVPAAFYTGTVVNSLGGADISWIIGIIVAAGLYYALMRPLLPALRAAAASPAGAEDPAGAR